MDDKKFEIENLTIYQKHLLDQMWSFETSKELKEWLGSLPTEVLREAVSLQMLLLLEASEHNWNEEGEDLSLAENYLKKFML